MCVHEKGERENIARRGFLQDGCLINAIFAAISGSHSSEIRTLMKARQIFSRHRHRYLLNSPTSATKQVSEVTHCRLT